MLILLIILSNCSKVNFSKNIKFYSHLKTHNLNDQKNVKKRGVNFVIGEEKKEEKKEEKSSNVSNTQIDSLNLKDKTFLELLNEDKKTYNEQKSHQEFITKGKKLKEKIDQIDYLKSSTLIDILEEEKKADEEVKSPEAESGTKNFEYDYSVPGYERTIGSDNGFYC